MSHLKNVASETTQGKRFLQKYQEYFGYQYDIYLAKNRLVDPFQFGTKGINKLKKPNMIENKQWKVLEK